MRESTFTERIFWEKDLSTNDTQVKHSLHSKLIILFTPLSTSGKQMVNTFACFFKNVQVNTGVTRFLIHAWTDACPQVQMPTFKTWDNSTFFIHLFAWSCPPYGGCHCQFIVQMFFSKLQASTGIRANCLFFSIFRNY